MASQNALLVFVKTPKHNFVKTRLATHLKSDEILAIYTAFLKDINKQFRDLNEIDLWYVISPENLELDTLAKYIDMNNYFMQSGTDLGERMCHALDYSANLNYNKSILIGSDVPDLDSGLISDALKLLEDTDCVLGPTIDGGYYLIGMKKCYPELFTNIEWSSEKVLDQTLKQAQMLNLKLRMLQILNDIDTYHDLQSLFERLKKSDRGSKEFPHHSWKALKQIMNH